MVVGWRHVPSPHRAVLSSQTLFWVWQYLLRHRGDSTVPWEGAAFDEVPGSWGMELLGPVRCAAVAVLCLQCQWGAEPGWGWRAEGAPGGGEQQPGTSSLGSPAAEAVTSLTL